MKIKKRSNAAGFTLVELLLVVVIIGILAAIVVPKLTGKGKEARIAAAKMDITNIMTSLEMFEQHIGRYPTTEEGLASLLMAPPGLPNPDKWKGPYLRVQELPLDPWDYEYKYEFPGPFNLDDFNLYSVGPDGDPGNDDDVRRP